MHETTTRRTAGAWALRATVVIGVLVAAGWEFARPELRASAVLRWEYRPGSALSMAWSHGRPADGESTCSRRRTLRVPGMRALTLRATWRVGG